MLFPLMKRGIIVESIKPVTGVAVKPRIRIHKRAEESPVSPGEIAVLSKKCEFRFDNRSKKTNLNVIVIGLSIVEIYMILKPANRPCLYVMVPLACLFLISSNANK